MRIKNFKTLFCIVLTTSFFTQLFSCKTNNEQTEEKPPNIVFIISDQWSAVASNGSGENKYPRTPNVDKLAASGVRFTQAYSPFPVCSPARVSMFTGQMPHRFNVVGNFHGDDKIDKNFKTLGEIFDDAGYKTAYFGKDHTGGGTTRGFQKTDMITNQGGWLTDGSIFDPISTRETVNFIKDNKDNPFFVALSLINPHDICTTHINGKFSYGGSYVDQQYLDPRFDEIDLPKNHADSIPIPKPMVPVYTNVPNPVDFDTTEEEWKEYLRFYYVLIENTDWNVGLVLETLKEAGVEDNTLVVFVSDHGDMMGAHRMRQKAVFYEEAARIPFICSFPGRIEPASVRHDFISLIDIMPTICSFAELNLPEKVDGKNLVPVIENKESNLRDHLISETSYTRMVRFGKYKYIQSVDGDEVLYDLDIDPGETNNIVENEELKAHVEKAREWLRKWVKETNDKFVPLSI